MDTLSKQKAISKTETKKSISNQKNRCYICDKDVYQIDSKLLLDAHVTTTNVSVAQTIGKLMGQNCMVLVAETDIICTECLHLFNEMDRLELELSKITTKLIDFLKIKYDLSVDNIIDHNSKRKLSDDLKRQDIERQLSEFYGTPVTVTEGKKRKSFPFKCPLCKLGFDEQKLLRGHVMETHLSKCGNCQEMFANRQNHSCKFQKKKFKCAICLLRFEGKDELNTHLRKHRAAFFKCGSCGDTFQKRDLLMKHLQLHTTKKVEKSTDKPIKFIDCKTCSLSYIDNEHYSAHLNSETHKKLEANIKTEKPVQTTEIYPEKPFLYKCLGCNALYDNTDELQLHILTTGHMNFNSEIQILSVENEDVQFITTTDATGEIKLITFQGDDQFTGYENTEKELNSLLNVVVTEEEPATVVENRSKIHILDEKTINLAQFINTDGVKTGLEGFQLNDLCNTLAVGSNILSSGGNISVIKSEQVQANLTPKITMEPQIQDQEIVYTNASNKIFKCCKCDFNCLSHEVIKNHMSTHKEVVLEPSDANSASQFFADTTINMVLGQEDGKKDLYTLRP